MSSPDGASIAFQSDRLGGVPRIFTMPSSGDLESVLTANFTADAPVWSPDGSLIAHTFDTGSELVIATTPVGGRQPVPLSDGGDFSPSWETVGAPLPTAACDSELATIEGTPGDDTLVGTPLVDVVVASGGDDEIRAADGGDVVCSGTGQDLVYGQGGNDVLSTGPQDDVGKGGPGRDELVGGPGDDVLSGGPQRDTANGGSGSDLCVAEVTRRCE